MSGLLGVQVLMVAGSLFAGFYMLIDTFENAGRRSYRTDALRFLLGALLILIGGVGGAFTLATF